MTQCLVASMGVAVTNSRGLITFDTPSFTGNACNQNFITYTISTIILDGIFRKGSALYVDLHLSLRVRICLSISGTCSSLATMLSAIPTSEIPASSDVNSLSPAARFTNNSLR